MFKINSLSSEMQVGEESLMVGPGGLEPPTNGL